LTGQASTCFTLRKKYIDNRHCICLFFFVMATLWKNPNGYYAVLWQESGKQRRKSLKTKELRIAKKLFNLFKRELVLNKIVPINGVTLKATISEFKTEFLDHVDAKLAASTYECYATAINKALDCWGDIPLGHVSPRHLDRLVKDMIRAGSAIATVNKNMRHLKRTFKQAYEWEYIEKPLKFPKPIKEKKKERFLQAEELRSILAEIHDPEFSDVVSLAVYTGLRSSEIIRLVASDIDNPKGFLRISSEQKNKNENRIPINPTARRILERCKSRGGEKLIRFQTRQTLSKFFKRAVRSAGMEDPRFHDLRHTFGSHLAMLGENEKTIQDLMRHESMASTMVYTHVSPEHLIEASNRVNFGPMPVPNPKKRTK